MTNKAVTSLTAATTPLSGTEDIHLIQGGNSRQTNISDVVSATTVSAAGAAMNSENLSGLASASTALTNLGGGTKGTAIFADNTNDEVLTELGFEAAGKAIAADATPADVRDYLDNAPYVTSRTALRALDTSKDTVAYFDGSYWDWDSSDLSAKITGWSVASSSVDAGTDTITTADPHGIWTREPLILSAAVNGVPAETVIYGISDTTTTFRLATSEANADAGTAIDLTGTTAMTVKRYFDPQEGMYVCPSATPTGSAGAWKRRAGADWLVTWFQAVGDNSNDDQPAWAGAIRLAGGNGGATIHGLPGHTYLLNSYHTRTLGGGAYIPGAVGNSPCLLIEGMENVHIELNGSTFDVGTDISDQAYLILAISNSEAAMDAGRYTKNISVRGGTFQKRRTGGTTNTNGTINISDAVNVLVENVELIGDGSGESDSGFSGTNNDRVVIRNCHLRKYLAGTDVCNWANSLFYKVTIDSETVDGTYGTRHFWDPNTASSVWLENALPYVQAHNLQYVSCEIVDYKFNQISSVEGLLIDRCTVRDNTGSSAGITTGIEVSTDSSQSSAGYETRGVIITGCDIYNIRNSGAGYSAGMRINDGSGSRPVYDVWIDGTHVHDNDSRGIVVETSNVNARLGQNDFESRDASGVQTINSSVNFLEYFGSNTGAVGVEAKGNSTNIDLQIKPKGTGKGHTVGPHQVDELLTAVGGIYSGSAQLTDDTATSITPPFNTGVVFFTVNAGIAYNYWGNFNVSGGSHTAVHTGSLATTGTSALSGTTGTDARMNYAFVNDGKLYIENRAGSLQTIYYTFIGH